MSLNAKKILEHIFENFICEKYLFWKNFRFLGPIFGSGDYRGGGKFCKLFLHILKDNFFNYKCCKFQKGF